MIELVDSVRVYKVVYYDGAGLYRSAIQRHSLVSVLYVIGEIAQAQVPNTPLLAFDTYLAAKDWMSCISSGALRILACDAELWMGLNVPMGRIPPGSRLNPPMVRMWWHEGVSAGHRLPLPTGTVHCRRIKPLFLMEGRNA